MKQVYERFELELWYHPGNPAHLWQISVITGLYTTIWDYVVYNGRNIQ